MKKYLIVICGLLFCCQNNVKKETINNQTQLYIEKPKLTIDEAHKLAQLPMHCVNIEYPNKLSQTLTSASDLKQPHELHPAFYGCFDWHSAVHGHWSMVKLLKMFPDIENAKVLEQELLNHISKSNIEREVAYFKDPQNKAFERTYGWAWLLKLFEELHTWDSPTARTLETNLQPLAQHIVEKYIEFLPKLVYPLRVGTHTNTAFGLSFAFDYALTTKNETLKNVIIERARFYFLNDKNGPFNWEPSGTDFLSPCLEEAALMKRVLNENEFKAWLHSFLPQLKDKNFTLETGVVNDRTDGHLVHLDGLNFSRAWSLCEIAKNLPEYQHLYPIAYHHINSTLPNIFEDSYEGGHWLGTFAIYALSVLPK